MGQGEQSIPRPVPPLLAYFRHTEPESAASDSTTRRLTDSKSALLQISWVHPLIGPQRAFEPFASLLLELTLENLKMGASPAWKPPKMVHCFGP
jgi:hypothetical protein